MLGQCDVSERYITNHEWGKQKIQTRSLSSNTMGVAVNMGVQHGCNNDRNNISGIDLLTRRDFEGYCSASKEVLQSKSATFYHEIRRKKNTLLFVRKGVAPPATLHSPVHAWMACLSNRTIGFKSLTLHCFPKENSSPKLIKGWFNDEIDVLVGAAFSFFGSRLLVGCADFAAKSEPSDQSNFRIVLVGVVFHPWNRISCALAMALEVVPAAKLRGRTRQVCTR